MYLSSRDSRALFEERAREAVARAERRRMVQVARQQTQGEAETRSTRPVLDALRGAVRLAFHPEHLR